MSRSILTGGSASGATPKTHDLLFTVQGLGSSIQLFSLIIEQAAWRLLLPVMTVLATCISMYLAWVFGASRTDHPIMSLLMGSGFAIMIVASRIFAILLDDEKAKPKDQRENVAELRFAFYACVLLSIITAANIMGEMQQIREDRRGAETGIALSAERGAVAAREYQEKANNRLRDATDAVNAARRAVEVAEADLEHHRREMAVKYPFETLTGAAKTKARDNYAWATLTTDSRAGGYPFQQTINTAQVAITAARVAEKEADQIAGEATTAVIDAERAYRIAREGAAPVKTVDPNAWFTESQKDKAWTYFWAIMLDVICFVAIGPARRLLKSLNAERVTARAVIRAATEKNDRADGGSDGAEDPDEPPMVLPAIVPGHYDKRLTEAYEAIQADGRKARVLREHGAKIESAVTAVIDKALVSVSYPAIRKSNFKMPNSAIGVLHEILINSNLAVKGAGNQVILK